MLDRIIDGKNFTRYVLAGVLAVVLFIAIGLVTASNMKDKEVSAESRESFQQYAEAVYACKAEDLNDTATVATLLEAMELEKVTGEYAVEIAPEGDVYTLAVTLTEPVKADKKASFDKKMEAKAQQLLALVPQIGEVQWSYTVTSTETKEEAAVVSVDTASAKKALGQDARDFGASQEDFEKLLSIQETL